MGGKVGGDLYDAVHVLGTDISPEASAASAGDVVADDFHVLQQDWKESWDFVYSNALDHSFDPGMALASWRHSLRENGLLILSRSSFHDTLHVDEIDIYGASLGDYCVLLSSAGFQIIEVVRIPTNWTYL